jgi:hypothetical protein
VAELRRGIEGGADHWFVRHGVEEGGGSARRDTAAHAGRQRCSVGSRMKKGVAPPPRWVDGATWDTEANWSAGLTVP